MSCSSQINTNNIEMQSSDTLGKNITKVEFNALVSKYTKAVTEKKAFDSSDYVAIVRLINTIEKNDLFEEHKAFRELFYPKLLNEAVKVLKATFWKGGCFYSADYDLFIGGKPHQNSQYRIIEK